MEIADLDGIIEEHVPCNPDPGEEKARVEPEKPAEIAGWWRILRSMVFHLCLVTTIAGVIVIYMKTQVDPDVSYKLAFWMMMGNAMDTGLFVKILLLGLMGLGIAFYFRKSMQKVKKEEQKARINAKEEASAVLELANREAAEVIEQAKKKANETMDDFWLLMQAKARDMGISSQDLQGLVKILQTAKEEAAAIMAQAQVKAQQAAERYFRAGSGPGPKRVSGGTVQDQSAGR